MSIESAPGRKKSRQGDQGTGLAQTAILDAAEERFARDGFEGTTVRAIAELAEVNPALVHYYFGSKEELIRQVVSRRASAINERRREGLLMLFAESSPRLPQLEQVIEVIVRSLIETGRIKRTGANFTALIRALGTANDPLSLALTADNFNGIARLSIDSIRRVVPGLGIDNAVRSYLLTIHSALNELEQTGRAEELSGNPEIFDDPEKSIAFVVSFMSAGIRSISTSN